MSHVSLTMLIIIIMYIYHALINALSAQMIHINLNMMFYTHVEHSPTKTIYIKYTAEHSGGHPVYHNHTITIQLYCQVSMQLHKECFVVPGTLFTHSHQTILQQQQQTWE